MRVLLVHNRYRTSAPSGEDAAVRNEQRMLERHGSEVVLFDRCNDDIDDSTLLTKTAAAARTVWSQRSRRDIRAVLRRVRPEIVHVHNTFSMVSPSIYGACKAEGVPVVQTLHNFRFFCPGAMFLRNGRPCEDCLDKSLLESVRHRCYRGSFGATATLASMLALHRALGTYSRHIDRYISLTEFARGKLLKAGIPDHKVTVKANFLPDPPPAGSGNGDYVVFVGRLLDGKGVETLLEAWRSLPRVRLKIVGDGALRARLEAQARQNGLNVEFTGTLAREQVLEMVGRARLLVVPSTWYEGFPLVVAEAFACGTPILASRIGSLEELVPDGIRGGLFEAGNAADLARRLNELLADSDLLAAMRRNARSYFDRHLSESTNHEQLLEIYRGLLDHAPLKRVPA